jgi:uncharacterized damage-inducible protein DinB
MITHEYCDLMARYNQWINARLYAVCAGFPDAERRRDRGAFFGSMHPTLNHLLWGDRMWLGRLVDIPCTAPAFGADMFDDFDQLGQERQATDRALLEWAVGVTPEMLASTIEYRSMVDGKTRRLPAAVAAVHLFNHGTHHRGQLTTLIKQAGRDPGATDLPWLPGLVQFVD